MDKSNSDWEVSAPKAFSRAMFALARDARELKEIIEMKEGPGAAEAWLTEYRLGEEAPAEAPPLATLAPTESERAAMAERGAIVDRFLHLKEVATTLWYALKEKHPEEVRKFVEDKGPHPDFKDFFRAFVTNCFSSHLADFETIAKSWAVWSRLLRPKACIDTVAIIATADALGKKQTQVYEALGKSAGNTSRKLRKSTSKVRYN